jgi:hypothetical protein
VLAGNGQARRDWPGEPVSSAPPVTSEMKFLGLITRLPHAQMTAHRSGSDHHAGRGKNVCFGSEADMTQENNDVRFTPESGHAPMRLACLLWATTRLTQRSKTVSSFD